MTRNLLNYVVDAITALLALAIVLTGMLLRWVLPPGSGRQRMLWGLDRHGWGDVHWWLALVLMGVLLLHVGLHWRWVCATTVRIARGSAALQSRLTSRLAGTAAAIALGLMLWGFVAVAQRSVVGTAVADTGALHQPDPLAAGLRGSMTLAEAAEHLHIDTAVLRARLRMDEATAANARLGQLARDRGMRMSELRRSAEVEGSTHGGGR